AAVPPARGPPQGRREPRALPRDGRDRPPGVDGGALRPPGAELHVTGPRHAVRPPAVPAGPRVAGRRPRAQPPAPPLWITVSTDRSVGFAAELGLRACYWQPPPRRIRQRMELYAEIRSR